MKQIGRTLALITVVFFVAFVLYYSSCDKKIKNVPQGPPRCGVGLPSCGGLRCINGYCRSDVPPAFPSFSDLRMAQ